MVPIAQLTPAPWNPRTIGDAAFRRLMASLQDDPDFFRLRPCLATRDGIVYAGNMRLRAAIELGWREVPCILADIAPELAKARALRDNNAAGEWVEQEVADLLAELQAAIPDFTPDIVGFEPDFLSSFAPDLPDEPGAVGAGGAASGPSLVERFGVPPFSVLDARQGYWQDRKARWIALGIESEVGRGTNLLHYSDQANAHGPKGKRAQAVNTGDWVRARGMEGAAGETAGDGTSIFDPVLTELLVRWFCPPGGVVLDPFAGGSVRGIVSALLGRQYHGIDLRPEQVEANESQRADIAQRTPMEHAPAWHVGDALDMEAVLPDGLAADFILTCPPYGDLEQYSDDPRDLSAMKAAEFDEAYARIIEGTVARMAPDSFAAYVVGDYRDKEGLYRNLPGRTIAAFEAAGARLYNEAILVTAVASLPIRAGRMFSGTRKLGKTHQNVLVFLKGDAGRAVARLGPVEVEMPEDAEDAEAAE